MKKKFYTLDVFTKNRLQGNPLAVVFDAQDLTDSQMLGIASEFNLSETVFLTLTEEQKVKARIFTPKREIPFAGHPTIGTATLLSKLYPDWESYALELQESTVHVAAQWHGEWGSAGFDSPGLPRNYSTHTDHEAVAKAVGLQAGDISFDKHIPCFVSASGHEWLFVPVKNAETIRKAAPDTNYWHAAHHGHKSVGIYLYCRECETAEGDWHARMFAPTMGISEDPATGSASITFPGAVIEAESLSDGQHDWLIEQGYEMGRPSQIRLTIDIKANQINRISLAGDATIVTEGTLTL